MDVAVRDMRSSPELETLDFELGTPRASLLGIMQFSLAISTPRAHDIIKIEMRIALPNGQYTNVEFSASVVRERRYTTTLDNNFAGVDLCARGHKQLIKVMSDNGMWDGEVFSAALQFIRAEAWRLMEPIAVEWRAHELANRPRCIRSGC